MDCGLLRRLRDVLEPWPEEDEVGEESADEAVGEEPAETEVDDWRLEAKEASDTKRGELKGDEAAEVEADELLDEFVRYDRRASREGSMDIMVRGSGERQNTRERAGQARKEGCLEVRSAGNAAVAPASEFLTASWPDCRC